MAIHALWLTDCLLCHTADDRSEHTLAKDAYLVGGDTLTDFFCPPTPGCIDFDSDCNHLCW